METPVVVADADKSHCRELVRLLESLQYRGRAVYSFERLKGYLKQNSCLVALLNINNLSVANRAIRDLAIANPGVYFLGLTPNRMNPELKESICYHIFACMTIPVDPDELLYWLKSIAKEALSPEMQASV